METGQRQTCWAHLFLLSPTCQLDSKIRPAVQTEGYKDFCEAITRLTNPLLEIRAVCQLPKYKHATQIISFLKPFTFVLLFHFLVFLGIPF